jgi:flagellar hook assembly protein FlgD
VTATVLGITGRPVRAIVADQPLRAGDHVLLWDGKDERGLRAPGGVYLVRTEARATTGGQGQAIATLLLP